MKILKIISLLLLMSSCRELVKYDVPDFEKVPVVNSILINDDFLRIHLSFAEKIDTNELQIINNAQIILFENSNKIDTLIFEGNNTYKSDIIIKSLKEYSCEINIPTYNTIICRETLPAPTEIQQLTIIENAGVDEEGYPYPAIKLMFSNKPSESQYFEIVLRVLHDEYVTIAGIGNISDPVLINEGIPLALFSNPLIDESNYTIQINYNSSDFTHNGNLSSPIIVEFRTVSYDYYQFKRQLYLYNQGRFPDGLLSNTSAFQLYSNIENGYGIFAGYSVFKSDTIFPSN